MRAHAKMYRDLEAKLMERYPEKITIAEKLSAMVVDPKRADAEQVWSVMWDKPLYAAVRVETAQKWVEALRPHMTGAWREWGANPAVFQIEKVGAGKGSSAYRVRGAVTQELRNNVTAALYRLHSIQGAAGALRARCPGTGSFCGRFPSATFGVC